MPAPPAPCSRSSPSSFKAGRFVDQRLYARVKEA
jgi:hypothetical protein